MSESEKVDWKRNLNEGVVIVASILLAFWIDAWWEERQEKFDEHAALSTLLEELRELYGWREPQSDSLVAMRESARRLLAFARDPDEAVSDRQLDYWLNDTTWSLSTRLEPLPALSSFTDGGNITLISDAELRFRITQLDKWLEYERGLILREQRFLDNRYYAYLDANGSIAQVYGADDGIPGIPPEPGSDSSGYPLGSEFDASSRISHRGVLAEREFQNLLIQRINMINAILGWGGGETLESSIAATIRLIERELEN